MRKEFMPVSAKLMERWFAGALDYSPTTDDEKAGIKFRTVNLIRQA